MKRDENRNVECKESWHDKYFEWICGYANANADKDLPQDRRVKKTDGGGVA